jgi:2'-5' RNA ligase superfamily protein
VAELTTDRETAVLVPVPEAERVVSPHRSRLDGAAALGVPAHVTVLFPFVPPPLLTSGVVDALAEAVATVSAFGCEFPATSWFGENVLYLAPRPDEPFRARVSHVWLMAGSGVRGSWHTLAELPLAAG